MTTTMTPAKSAKMGAAVALWLETEAGACDPGSAGDIKPVTIRTEVAAWLGLLREAYLRAGAGAAGRAAVDSVIETAVLEAINNHRERLGQTAAPWDQALVTEATGKLATAMEAGGQMAEVTR